MKKIKTKTDCCCKVDNFWHTLVELQTDFLCPWVKVFCIFKGCQGRFHESCKSVEKIFEREGGWGPFIVKKISSSSFLNLRKNNITIWSEIMWKRFFFSVKFYRRFCDDATKNRIVVFSYIYDSQREITRFILRLTGNKSYRDSMRFLSKNDNRSEDWTNW